MRTPVIPAILVALGLCLLSGCVSTRVHEFHRDAAYDQSQYEKLIVHCSAENADHRRLMEDIVAERLRRAGYDATASHHVKPARSSDRFKIADYPGYDALVWVGWGGYEETVTRTPGHVEHYVSFGYGYGGHRHGRHHRRHHGHFSGGFGTVVHLPSERRRWWLRTRIELIDARTEKKVWGGKADTTSGDRDLSDLAIDLGDEIVSIMGRTPGTSLAKIVFLPKSDIAGSASLESAYAGPPFRIPEFCARRPSRGGGLIFR